MAEIVAMRRFQEILNEIGSNGFCQWEQPSELIECFENYYNEIDDLADYLMEREYTPCDDIEIIIFRINALLLKLSSTHHESLFTPINDSDDKYFNVLDRYIDDATAQSLAINMTFVKNIFDDVLPHAVITTIASYLPLKSFLYNHGKSWLSGVNKYIDRLKNNGFNASSIKFYNNKICWDNEQLFGNLCKTPIERELCIANCSNKLSERIGTIDYGEWFKNIHTDDHQPYEAVYPSLYNLYMLQDSTRTSICELYDNYIDHIMCDYSIVGYYIQDVSADKMEYLNCNNISIITYRIHVILHCLASSMVGNMCHADDHYHIYLINTVDKYIKKLHTLLVVPNIDIVLKTVGHLLPFEICMMIVKYMSDEIKLLPQVECWLRSINYISSMLISYEGYEIKTLTIKMFKFNYEI